MRTFTASARLAAFSLVTLASAAHAQEATPATPGTPPATQPGAQPPAQTPDTPATPPLAADTPPGNLDVGGMARPRTGLLVTPGGGANGSNLTPAEQQRQNTPVDERNRLVIEQADDFTYEEVSQTLTFTGDVALRYNGYHVTCDRASYNQQTRVVTLESNVRIDTGTQSVFADYIEVDRRTNEFRTRGGRTVLAPEQVSASVLQPVIISGDQLLRSGKNFRATNGFFTTCDFPNPHYKIGFRQADVIPNNRIVLRDASFYRYDRKLFRIPYLVVPIRDDINYSYLPLVGRSQEEGYFIKAGIGYGLARLLPGILRVDLMEKKGVGLGFDQAYKFGENSAGTVAFYNLNDRNRDVQNRNGRLNHQQYLGDVLATIQSDFQNNSYQSITSSSQTGTTTVSLARNTSARDSAFSITRSTSDYTTNDSVATSYQLQQTERFGLGNSISLRLTGADNTSRSFTTIPATDTTQATTTTTESGRSEQNADLQANARLGIFDASVAANKNLNLSQKGSGVGAAFTGTQKLPDFLLRTDTTRFKDGGAGGLSDLLRRLPASYSIGFGRYLENVQTFNTTTSGYTTQAITTNRFLFEVTPRDKTATLTPNGGLTATFGGNFRQLMYREDSAQYILTGNGRLTQKLGALSSFNLNYNYLRPYGAAPEEFRLDSTGTNNNVGATLTVDTYRTRASIISGYDLQTAWGNDIVGQSRRRPWQNLSAQVSYRASPLLQTRFTASYDINSGRLLDATNRIRIRGRGEFALDTGLRYDPNSKRFPQITEVLTLPITSRDVLLTALSSYNSQTSRFDYKQFGLVWRFHDYEYNFSYVDQPYGFRTERGFNFSIRLYALPSPTQQRTGQYGTPLDTGTGEVF